MFYKYVIIFYRLKDKFNLYVVKCIIEHIKMKHNVLCHKISDFLV